MGVFTLHGILALYVAFAGPPAESALDEQPSAGAEEPPGAESGPEEQPDTNVEAPDEAEAPADKAAASSKPSAGFSLDRGPWLEWRGNQFGIGLLSTIRYGADIQGVGSPGVDTLGFSLPYVRPNLHAKMFDGKVRALVQIEVNGANPHLLDAELVYQPFAAFGLDIGRYRPHVSRAWITGIPVLSMPGRGTIDDTFHGNRALGLTVFGRPFDGRFEYDFGVFNGDADPDSLEPMVTGRLAYNPLGKVPYTQTPNIDGVDSPRFAFGINSWSDRFTPDPANPADVGGANRRVTLGGDFVFMSKRVHALVEGFGRWQLRKADVLGTSWGSQAQVGVMVIDRTLELQARAGLYGPLRGQPLQGIWEGGLAWYLWGNHLRAQLHYLCSQDLTLPACSTHRVQLQAQLWF
jgi:hypothetical protein